MANGKLLNIDRSPGPLDFSPATGAPFGGVSGSVKE
jgi:hypothetical protein